MRGDAIAGLIITAINVVGGVFIDMLRHDLTASWKPSIEGRDPELSASTAEPLSLK